MKKKKKKQMVKKKQVRKKKQMKKKKQVKKKQKKKKKQTVGNAPFLPETKEKTETFSIVFSS